MSDTSHSHVPATGEPTEGDGVSYRGLVWFMAILVGTTLACQALMWGMFVFMDREASKDDAAHPSLALAYGTANERCVPEPTPGGGEQVGHTPCITKDGQIDPGRAMPQPNLMADDPLGLKVFRASEDQILEHYGVVDKNAGTYRIPVDRAKELLLQRGIPGGVIPPAAAPVKK